MSQSTLISVVSIQATLQHPIPQVREPSGKQQDTSPNQNWGSRITSYHEYIKQAAL